MNYLIIGGVAGGATVAARLRRMDEKANIILFERGKYVSYANCGLPYYIGDTINNREKLFVQTAKGFTDRFRIDIRTEQEVTAIRPDKKEVEIKNLSTGETYTETYDKLVLSPGAEPLRPGIEGIGSKKIFTLRNVPDTDTIKNYVNTENPKRAIVVGGGFIGLEMAENLYDLGIQVDVVEMANQVMAPLDFSMAAIVHRQLTDKGVGLHLEDGVSRFEEKDGGVTVHLRSGKQIATDMVLLSIGVRPETKLAKDAGLAIGGRHRRKRLYANFRCRYICPRRRSRSTPSRNRTAGPYSAGRAGKQAGTHRGRQYRIRQQKEISGINRNFHCESIRPDSCRSRCECKVITTEQYTLYLFLHTWGLSCRILSGSRSPVHQNIVRSGKREIVRRPDCRLQRCRQTYRDAGTSDTARRYSPRPGGIGTCLCTSLFVS